MESMITWAKTYFCTTVVYVYNNIGKARQRYSTEKKNSSNCRCAWFSSFQTAGFFLCRFSQFSRFLYKSESFSQRGRGCVYNTMKSSDDLNLTAVSYNVFCLLLAPDFSYHFKTFFLQLKNSTKFTNTTASWKGGGYFH